MPHKELPLESLADIPSLPRGSHISFVQKSSVCFDNQGFSRGLVLLVECKGMHKESQDDFVENFFRITWKDPVDDVLRLSYADREESVEDSAKAIGMLLITNLTKYKMGRQSPRGTHIDYFLVDINAELPFQSPDVACVEFTGIISGLDKIKHRMKVKRDRLADKRDFPTYIVCVEHSYPVAQIERVEP